MAIRIHFQLITCVFLIFCGQIPALAASAVTTINVTVARFLTVTNTSTMEFGTVSVGSTAGAVTIGSDGKRYAVGGVTINPAENFAPAIFLIEGKPYENFVVKLPDKVELRDGRGNTIEVNQFKSSIDSGALDANGLVEIKIGGQIDLDANQSTGDYSGTMVVELNYS